MQNEQTMTFQPDDHVRLDDRTGVVVDVFASGAIVRVRWDGEVRHNGDPYVSDVGAVRLTTT